MCFYEYKILENMTYRDRKLISNCLEMGVVEFRQVRSWGMDDPHIYHLGYGDASTDAYPRGNLASIHVNMCNVL